MRMRFFVSSSSIEDAKSKITASLSEINCMKYRFTHSEKYWKEESVHIVDVIIDNSFNDINSLLNNYSDD